MQPPGRLATVFVAPTALRAVKNLVPIARPLFSPSKWLCAGRTDFLWQKRLGMLSQDTPSCRFAAQGHGKGQTTARIVKRE
jgi:hypothetical protein